MKAQHARASRRPALKTSIRMGLDLVVAALRCTGSHHEDALCKIHEDLREMMVRQGEGESEGRVAERAYIGSFSQAAHPAGSRIFVWLLAILNSRRLTVERNYPNLESSHLRKGVGKET